jgi:hypothetical protein
MVREVLLCLSTFSNEIEQKNASHCDVLSSSPLVEGLHFIFLVLILFFLVYKTHVLMSQLVLTVICSRQKGSEKGGRGKCVCCCTDINEGVIGEADTPGANKELVLGI